MELPVELRLQIWRYAFPEPQFIDLREGNIPRFESLAHPSPRSWTTTLTTLPITLWICQESRQETLRTYQLCFARDWFPAQTYVDFARDVVYFRDLPHSIQSADSKDLMYELLQVRYLALNVRNAAQFVDQRAECLRNLEELILVNYSNSRKAKVALRPVVVADRENLPRRMREAVSRTEEKLRENTSHFPRGDTPVVKLVELK
jgi:hypothetical protein